MTLYTLPPFPAMPLNRPVTGAVDNLWRDLLQVRWGKQRESRSLFVDFAVY